MKYTSAIEYPLFKVTDMTNRISKAAEPLINFVFQQMLLGKDTNILFVSWIWSFLIGGGIEKS